MSKYAWLFNIFHISIKMSNLKENKIMKLSNNSKFIKNFSCRWSTLQKISHVKIASLQNFTLCITIDYISYSPINEYSN